MVVGFSERGERAMHLQVRHHVPEFVIEDMEEGENHLPIFDQITKLAQCGSHGFKAAAIISDGHGALIEVVKLSLKEKCMGLTVAKELTLKEPPGAASIE